MLTGEKLEEKQISLYFVVILIATGFGLFLPNFAGLIAVTISLVISLLMYSMFSQIPFASLKKIVWKSSFYRCFINC